MRKEYHKPQLFAESFMTMEHIAGNCKVDPSVDNDAEGPHGFNSGTSNGCAYGLNDGEWQVFTGTNPSCGKPAFGDDWNNVDLGCYNAFDDGIGSLFGS